jgi:hypothetical protein
MWFLVVAMLVILVLAGTVVLFVAFPLRGEDVPHVPWLGRLLRKGVDNVPTLENTSAEPEPEFDTSSLTLDLSDLDHGRPEHRR